MTEVETAPDGRGRAVLLATIVVLSVVAASVAAAGSAAAGDGWTSVDGADTGSALASAVSGDADETPPEGEPDAVVTERESDAVAAEDVSFGDVEAQQEGDVVRIPLSLPDAGDQDAVGFTIDEDDYHANVTVDISDFDGDELIVEWNTYYAGWDADEAFGVDSAGDGDARITSVAGEDGAVYEQQVSGEDGFRLNPSDYLVSLYAEDDDGVDFHNRVDSIWVPIEQRHTGEADVSIAPSDAYDEGNLEHLLDNATDADTVAEGDLVVVEQEVSGVFGYAVQDDRLTSGVEFEVTATESPVYADPASFDETDEEVIGLVERPAENALYVVIEVEQDGLESGDVSEWAVEFAVTDENPYVDEDDAETVETGYTVTERTLDLDVVEEPYQVLPDAEAGEIRGTTTLAPGSTVDVTVQKPQIFRNEGEVEVTLENGERVFSYGEDEDFGDRDVGDEFAIVVEGEDVGPVSYDGVFADTPEWETMTDLEAIADLLGVEEDEILEAIADLRAENDALAAELEAIEDERDRALAELESLENERDELQDEIVALEDQIVALEAEIDDLEGDLADADSEIDALEAEITELEAEKAALEDDVDALTDEIDTLEAVIDDLEAENADLEATIDALTDEIDALEAENADLEAAFEDEVAALEAENDRLRDDLALADVRMSEFEQAVAEFEAETDDLEAENAELRERIDELEGTRDELDELDAEAQAHGYDTAAELIDSYDGDDGDDGDDGLSGFGVGVAVVALIGAALVAARRQ